MYKGPSCLWLYPLLAIVSPRCREPGLHAGVALNDEGQLVNNPKNRVGKELLIWAFGLLSNTKILTTAILYLILLGAFDCHSKVETIGTDSRNIYNLLQRRVTVNE